MSNARNIARLNTTTSGIIAPANVDQTSLTNALNSTNVVNALGYTPVNKAGDIISGILRIRHSSGGEWAMLGAAYSDAGGSYLHIKTSLHRDSYKMVGFKVSGFYPYNAYGEGFFGCYTYGPNTTTQPYGVIAQNQGNQSVAGDMYYSSDNYVVLRCNWGTTYNGLQVEYISAGGAYGNHVGMTMLAYRTTASTTGAY